MRLLLLSLFLTLTLVAQTLPDAAALRKQAQEAAKKRQSIQYVSELIGEVTQNGAPVTEVVSLGRRIPVSSAVGKQTVAVQNPGKGARRTRTRRG
jgi:hypothetical protein